MSDNVRATGVATFEQDVLAASRQVPVLVDFWAAWCGPCKTLAPILESLAHNFTGRLSVLKVDTDTEQELAARFQIRSIPTVILTSVQRGACWTSRITPLPVWGCITPRCLQGWRQTSRPNSLRCSARQWRKGGSAAKSGAALGWMSVRHSG